MIRFWLVAAVALILDQYTKHVVATNFVPGESRIAIPHVLWWTYVQNFHGAFGMFGSQSWVLVLMAVAVLALFAFLFKDAASQSPLLRAAFGGIVGGAIGNIIDRFHYGYVVDFADLHWWPVFNVADSFITVCVGVLLASSLLSSLHRPDATAAAATGEPGHAPPAAPAASPQAPAEFPH